MGDDLARHCRCDQDSALVGVLAAVSGLAAAHEFPADTAPLCPLYIDAPDGRWDRLFRQLLEPVAHKTGELQRQAQASDRESLRYWMKTLEKACGISNPDSEGASQAFRLLPHRQLLQPVTYLRDPDAAALEAGMAESFDRRIFVDLTGTHLFAGLKNSNRRESLTRLAMLLDRYLRGNSFAAKPDADETNPLKARTGSVSAIASVDRHVLADLVGCRDPASAALLAHFIVIEPEPFAGGDKTAETAGRGRENYRNLVRRVFDRRQAPQYPLEAADAITPPGGYSAYERDLDTLADAVPARARRHLRPLRDLPLRLGRVLAFLVDSANADDVPMARSLADTLARRLAAKHVDTVVTLLAGTSEKSASFELEAMYQKIAEKQPVDMRTLLRSYQNQRRAVHEPVLEELIQQGRVVRRADGMFETAKEAHVAAS